VSLFFDNEEFYKNFPESLPLYTGFKPLLGVHDVISVHNELVIAINNLHERLTEIEKRIDSHE